jgi:uncharacterized protein (DUF1499 family)
MGIWTALTRNVASTRPDAADPRLRTRAYPVPYARVWDAALQTAHAAPGWTVTSASAGAGTIQAEARTRLWGFTDDVAIHVALDGSGMTRVDLRSSSRVGRADLGTNARRVARFLHALDARLRLAGEGGAPANR